MNTSPWRVTLCEPNFDDREAEAAKEVVSSGWLTMGARVQAFEQRFAELIGVKHAIAVCNCTAALDLSNRAFGISTDDEVICPAYTFVAGANMIRAIGATPVFADISSDTDLNISAETIAPLITKKTKAIHVVHFAGFAADMGPILDLAKQHGLAVIEDCAHAPGASHLLGPCGGIGDIGCFSLYSNKNITTGEGGLITTNDDALADKLRLMRSHGMTSSMTVRHSGKVLGYDVATHGFNYRFDEMRAAIGLIQLEKLSENNKKRAAIVRSYRQKLSTLDVLTLPFGDRQDGVHHIMPILLPEGCNRDTFRNALTEQRVQSSFHYPPSHLFAAFQTNKTVKNVNLARTEQVALREVTLPLHPLMTDEDVSYVCDAVKKGLKLCGF